MDVILGILIYLAGILVAYNQIPNWCDHKITTEDDYYKLFLLSLLSWSVFPIYLIVYIANKAEEE